MTSQQEAIRQIQQSEETTITPALAAAAIGSDPQWIRYVAKNSPEQLGFRVIRLNSRVKIPRIPFLEYLGIEAKEETGDDQ